MHLRMRFICYFLCIFASLVNAQIPNGNFEDWETSDTIETPVSWKTNNYYVGFTPVLKTSDAIQGNYSMKISSTARDVNGLPTWPGCAHVKLVPDQLYQFMTASVRIDSAKEGRIEIRVKQRNSDGFYDKIGGWVRSSVTNGVNNIWFAIEQLQMDTLLIEVWAINKDVSEWEVNSTYVEGIIDNLGLTNTVATIEPSNAEEGNISLWPNPANDYIKVSQKGASGGYGKLNIIDMQGNVQYEQERMMSSEITVDISKLQSGTYILEAIEQNIVTCRKKFVVSRR